MLFHMSQGIYILYESFSLCVCVCVCVCVCMRVFVYQQIYQRAINWNDDFLKVNEVHCVCY